MPAPPKTSDAQIVDAARRLLESRGREGFSLTEVAAAVGVRAPSLYRRFADRAAILAAVELSLWRDLAEALAGAIVPRRSFDTLRSQARAYRTFAKAHPNGYSLMFDVQSRHTEEGTRVRTNALAPAMPGFTGLVGKENALLAARVLTPFLHGFVSMEIGDAFRLGGGLDAAFEHGVVTILHGLASGRGRARRR
ncbi:MAG TPA: TetR/AcrR family transcriptional regulator [Steroidobacteraceae bacterium]|nr:TetR/AcrR family transcriptional regulator [Steroidobacteraceae bacterium]